MDPKFAEDCIACGQCERKCTQHLPIERLKHIADIKQYANFNKTFKKEDHYVIFFFYLIKKMF